MKLRTSIRGITLSLMLMPAVTGCKTFNYTDKDAERERQYMLTHGGWGYGHSAGIGGWGAGAISIGDICPSVGSFCPGK